MLKLEGATDVPLEPSEEDVDEDEEEAHESMAEEVPTDEGHELDAYTKAEREAGATEFTQRSTKLMRRTLRLKGLARSICPLR